MNDIIKVSLEVGKGIMVHADGKPSVIVAYGAAAAVATIGAAVTYAIYTGGKSAVKQLCE